ncbi:hypothetical protein PT2222_370028 [Paraburkholderia tropica]
MAGFHGIGELRERVEVVVGDRVSGLDRAARAGHAMTALDPAARDAQFAGDADVVILALRHVQIVFLAEAPGLFVAAARVREIARVRLLAQRVVAGEQHGERLAERLREMRERPRLRVRHRHQLEMLGETLQCFNGVRKRGPFRDRIAKAFCDLVAFGQAEARRDQLPAQFEIVGIPDRARALARLAIGGEEIFVRDFGVAGHLMQVVQHAALEIDEGTDDVERQDFEAFQTHV